jgi:hypothetical protein
MTFFFDGIDPAWRERAAADPYCYQQVPIPWPISNVETRISQLESQLDEVETARTTAVKVREGIERQHAEIRQLIMNSHPGDGDFQARLLHELQLVDDVLEKEMSSRFYVPAMLRNFIRWPSSHPTNVPQRTGMFCLTLAKKGILHEGPIGR